MRVGKRFGFAPSPVRFGRFIATASDCRTVEAVEELPHLLNAIEAADPIAARVFACDEVGRQAGGIEF
jgi:hypothetical protein